MYSATRSERVNCPTLVLSLSIELYYVMTTYTFKQQLTSSESLDFMSSSSKRLNCVQYLTVCNT